MNKGFKIVAIILITISLVMSGIALFGVEADFSEEAIAKIKPLYGKECIFTCDEAGRFSTKTVSEKKVIYIITVYDGTTDEADWRVEVIYNKYTQKVSEIKI